MASTQTKVRHHVGMGSILHEHGVAFRVWAPNASAVSVTDNFNDWSTEANPIYRINTKRPMSILEML